VQRPITIQNEPKPPSFEPEILMNEPDSIIPGNPDAVTYEREFASEKQLW
jgi:hypothetical protein